MTLAPPRPEVTVARSARAALRQRRYRTDPDLYARERLGVESWSIPRRIRQSVLEHRATAVPSCHESSKTHTAATIAAWWVDTHPPDETLVFTTAPENHQVIELLWGDLKGMHTRAGLPGSITKDARWFIGETLVARGKKTSDLSNPEQAMQSIQGRHAKYPLVIVDEAGGVPAWLFHALMSIIANDNGRILAIGNPDDPASYFASEILTDPDWNVLPISAFDTPRWTGESVSEDLLERLIGEIYVERVRKLGEDSNIWQSKVLGQVPDVSDSALFPLRLVRRAQANYRAGALAGIDRGGFGIDVAGEGTDETCVYRNRGGVIEHECSWAKQDTEESADRINTLLSKPSNLHVPAVVDAVGVGKGVFDKLRRRGRKVVEFGGGERALNPDDYPNRRTEILWEFRLAMEDGLIALDPEDLELESQMVRIRWRPHSRYVCEIETKKEMRKRGVKSPDRVDAVAMALAAPRPTRNPDDPWDPKPLYPTELATVSGTLTGDLMERAL